MEKSMGHNFMGPGAVMAFNTREKKMWSYQVVHQLLPEPYLSLYHQITEIEILLWHQMYQLACFSQTWKLLHVEP